jgi:DNA-binding MarR family transcriptional regulator
MSDDIRHLGTAVGEVADVCLALRARRAANRLARLYNAHLAEVGLEVAQFSTLCVIADGRITSVQAIADYLGAERSTLARNLKLLVRKGLVAETPGQGRLAYGLTPSGAHLVARAIPLWRNAQAAAEAHTNPA